MTNVLMNCVRYGLLRCERPKPWIAQVRGPSCCHIGTAGGAPGTGIAWGEAEPAGDIFGAAVLLCDAGVVVEMVRLAALDDDEVSLRCV